MKISDYINIQLESLIISHLSPVRKEKPLYVRVYLNIRTVGRMKMSGVYKWWSYYSFSEDLNLLFKLLFSPIILDSAEKFTVCHFKYVCSVTISNI